MMTRPRIPLRDVGIAIVAVGLDTVFFTGVSQDDDQVGWAGEQPNLAFILAGAVAVPILAFRRRAPEIVCLALASYSVVVTVTLGFRPLISPLVALYSVAVLLSLRWSVACLLAVLSAHAVAVSYEASFPNVTSGDVALVATLYVVLDVTTWAAGRWGAGAAARARHAELEKSRAELVQKSVIDERVRIARELHDIVTHAVTAMTLQAAGAKRSFVTDPQRAVSALESVERLGQQSMAELRRLLAVLHAGDISKQGALDDRGLQDIPHLLDSMRDAGVQATYHIEGVQSQLDPSVSLAAYRVVQEALTNAVRHAPGAAVHVRCSWRGESVELTVTNAVTRSAVVPVVSSLGIGLAGLSERLRLLGGTFSARDAADGTFVVQASLPTTATTIWEGS